MKVSEFVRHFPQYAIDFTSQVRDQKRIYDGITLDQFPTELEPDFPYHPGSRGRPNQNQTLAHSQCATCQRVLRNDFFYTVPSMMKRNVVFSHCRECNQHLNAVRYDTRADLIRARRIIIWQYFAPRCAICGFEQHMSAMDLHHPDHKEAQIAELITSATLSLHAGTIEALIHEAKKCIPLCSNCHRMIHANDITLPPKHIKPIYRIAELLMKLNTIR
jgi:hypothetical protein